MKEIIRSEIYPIIPRLDKYFGAIPKAPNGSIKNYPDSEERNGIVSFFRESKRGIIRSSVQ